MITVTLDVFLWRGPEFSRFRHEDLQRWGHLRLNAGRWLATAKSIEMTKKQDFSKTAEPKKPNQKRTFWK